MARSGNRWRAWFANCSPRFEEGMDPGEILGPEPIEVVKITAFDAVSEPSVVNAGHAMPGMHEQACQCRIIDLRHHVIVEDCLALAVKDFVGENAAHPSAHEALETKIRALDLGRKRQEELPEINVSEWSANRYAHLRRAGLVRLDADSCAVRS